MVMKIDAIHRSRVLENLIKHNQMTECQCSDAEANSLLVGVRPPQFPKVLVLKVSQGSFGPPMSVAWEKLISRPPPRSKRL